MGYLREGEVGSAELQLLQSGRHWDMLSSVPPWHESISCHCQARQRPQDLLSLAWALVAHVSACKEHWQDWTGGVAGSSGTSTDLPFWYHKGSRATPIPQAAWSCSRKEQLDPTSGNTEHLQPSPPCYRNPNQYLPLQSYWSGSNLAMSCCWRSDLLASGCEGS